MDKLKEELLVICRDIYRKGLVCATGGNVSLRINKDRIIITPHGVSLGYIDLDDILIFDMKGNRIEGKGTPSVELKLHIDIYKELDAKVIIHSHPPYTIALSAVGIIPKGLDFESALFLGKVKVIPQKRPTMMETSPIIDALKLNNIVILKNHGAVTIGRDLKEAFFLTEILEESSKMLSVGKLFGKVSFPFKDRKVKKRWGYRLFSEEHIRELINIVNRDKPLDGMDNLSVGIKVDEKILVFKFKNGKIKSVDYLNKADFIFEGLYFHWLNIFNGDMNPFTAVIQGKINFIGNFNRLTELYPQFSKIFELWQQIGVNI
jgi:L-fuculose-phosphate aldolase